MIVLKGRLKIFRLTPGQDHCLGYNCGWKAGNVTDCIVGCKLAVGRDETEKRDTCLCCEVPERERGLIAVGVWPRCLKFWGLAHWNFSALSLFPLCVVPVCSVNVL